MNPAALNALTGTLKGTEAATVMEILILLTVLSVAPLLAEAIRRIHLNQSVSMLFT